jgi:hypothetical protein
VHSAAKTFANYAPDASNWITLATGEYYPDILPHACELYKPVLVLFGQVLKGSESSVALFMNICEIREGWMCVQLARVFRKYVCPSLSVEMLRRKRQAKNICDRFAGEFRKIVEVQRAYATRPIPDEALCALLWEYKDRGKKGYDLTQRFFAMIRQLLPDYEITGPERAGQDILMGTVWPDYTKLDRPADFVIRKGNSVLAIGFARYDGDRGGSQEDDRTGGYRDCAAEILAYTAARDLHQVKVIFLNDGPGLLLGSMWRDYALLEELGKGRIRVVTLRMIQDRLTRDWLES